MKRVTLSFCIVLMMAALAACGNRGKNETAQGVIEQSRQNTESGTEVQQPSEENQDANKQSNILIAYFSVPETDGVDTVASASRVATVDGVLGNTEFIAAEIQKNLGGDLFAIETEQEYPGTHDKLLDFAYNEKSDHARPKLAAHIDNLDDYDYIFIGYPDWNADLPMPLYTFLEEYDFSGKTIIPFVTHGGSSFAGTIQTIQSLEPEATVVEAGLSVSRNSVANAQSDVKKWTDSLISD